MFNRFSIAIILALLTVSASAQSIGPGGNVIPPSNGGLVPTTPTLVAPTTASLLQISAATASVTPRVLKTGYYTEGDMPAAVYTYSGTACTLNSGSGDGGSQFPVTAGGCWNLTAQVSYDIRWWGAVSNWNGSTGTDQSTYINAAISVVCSASATGGRIRITGGGLPYTLANPTSISQISCPSGRILWDLQIYGIGTAWSAGVTTTASEQLINATYSPPILTQTIWAPNGQNYATTYPNTTVTSATLSSGVWTINLAASLGLVVGNRVLIGPGAYTVTSISGTTITVANTYNETIAIGTTVWGPMPIGLLDITSAGADVQTAPGSGVHCNGITSTSSFLSQCVPIVDMGQGQKFNRMHLGHGMQIDGWAYAGVFVAGSGASIQSDGAIIRQLGTITGGLPVAETGYGIYLTGNTGDDYFESDTEIADTWASAFVDGSTDVNFDDCHNWNGSSGSGSGPYYNRWSIIYSGAATGKFHCTVDGNPILLVATSAGTPSIQLTGNMHEIFSNGAADAPVVYRGASTIDVAGANAYSLTAAPLLGFDPYQWSTYQLTSLVGGWLWQHAIVLEDANGLLDSSAWSYIARDMAQRVNNEITSLGKPWSNPWNQSAISNAAIIGTTTNGSFVIGATTLFPAPGAAVTASCGSLEADATVSLFSYKSGWLQMVSASGGTPGASCTGATITVNGVSWTGGVITAGNNLITSIAFPSVSLLRGASITATGIPANSWLSAEAPFGSPTNLGVPLLEFDNPTHTPATSTNVGTQITITPATYTVQQEDNGSVLLANTASAQTISVVPKVRAGFSVEFDNVQAQTLPITISPTGSATINGAATALTIPNVVFGVSHLLGLRAISGSATAYDLATPGESTVLGTFTVSTLPTCGTATKGKLAMVTDASSPVWNTALTGGSSTVTGALCNGTAWIAQ